MEGKTFRLGEYLITDFGSGLIGWEAHHDFGVQRSGRCHQWGEVLVVGEFEEEKTGYLKGEFLDRLKTLPPWDPYPIFLSVFPTADGGRRPGVRQ